MRFPSLLNGGINMDPLPISRLWVSLSVVQTRQKSWKYGGLADQGQILELTGTQGCQPHSLLEDDCFIKA